MESETSGRSAFWTCSATDGSSWPEELLLVVVVRGKNRANVELLPLSVSSCLSAVRPRRVLIERTSCGMDVAIATTRKCAGSTQRSAEAAPEVCGIDRNLRHARGTPDHLCTQWCSHQQQRDRLTIGTIDLGLKRNPAPGVWKGWGTPDWNGRGWSTTPWSDGPFRQRCVVRFGVQAQR